jgi:hypothetical protein
MFPGNRKWPMCALQEVPYGFRDPPRGGVPGIPPITPAKPPYPPKLRAVLALVSALTKGGGVYPLLEKGGFRRPPGGRFPYSSYGKVHFSGHGKTPLFLVKHRPSGLKMLAENDVFLTVRRHFCVFPVLICKRYSVKGSEE